jgi:tetratricopeptide (TPR) repeat protein
MSMFNGIVISQAPDGESAEVPDGFLCDVYLKKAEALFELGKYDDAIQAIEKIIEISPMYLDLHIVAEALILKADIFKKTGRAEEATASIEEAMVTYDKLISYYPDEAPFYISKGDILKDLGRIDEAMGLYLKAKEIEPGIYTPEIDGELNHPRD